LAISFYVVSSATAQSFEGKISYRNSYRSKLPNISDAQFTEMMGATQQYFVKGGNYRSETNGSFFQWQMYLNSENKVYSKLSTSEVILWNDAGENKDALVKVEVNKKVATVLDHVCDEVVVTTSSGVYKFYFNSGVLKVDGSLYGKHKFLYWNEYLAKANAFPLKVIFDDAKFSFESVVTGITPLKIDDKIFELPPGAEFQKNPY